ncbi:hypothetical protein [Acinetobacter bereziniae]|uniref:hypothetical protein n=1 Tax=Acinetobacter bereziniae TaxID=106648 RepID=UPI0018FF9C76|nr:hypothetical protein [Acinetobacter bereziniae]MBJ8445902.1 hypothetical protein [Acinetobacter bereziniae]
MTVENQIPYQSFTANGSTTVFPILFEIEGEDNVKVKANGGVVSTKDYSYDRPLNAIVFYLVPTENTIIEVERETNIDRSTQYETYNNSFRPEVLNEDLDRIIRILQELDYTDSVIVQNLAKEILERAKQDKILQTQITQNTLTLATVQQIQQQEIQNRINGDLQVALNAKAYTDFMVTMNNTNPTIFSRYFRQYRIH